MGGDEYISIEIASPGAGQAVAEIHRFQKKFTFIRKGVWILASLILFIRVVPVFFLFSRMNPSMLAWLHSRNCLIIRGVSAAVRIEHIALRQLSRVDCFSMPRNPSTLKYSLR